MAGKRNRHLLPVLEGADLLAQAAPNTEILTDLQIEKTEFVFFHRDRMSGTYIQACAASAAPVFAAV